MLEAKPKTEISLVVELAKEEWLHNTHPQIKLFRFQRLSLSRSSKLKYLHRYSVEYSRLARSGESGLAHYHMSLTNLSFGQTILSSLATYVLKRSEPRSLEKPRADKHLQ